MKLVSNSAAALIRNSFLKGLYSFLLLAGLTYSVSSYSQISSAKTVFLIVMTGHSWSDIHGSANAPFINSLLPQAAFTTNYFSSTNSFYEANYIWLEAGTDFGVSVSLPKSTHEISSTNHLTALLNNAGISWKVYQEGITGAGCPLNSSGLYQTKFNPFIYFDDITDNQSSGSAMCVSHIRPLNDFDADLSGNNLARYNFIKPNVCNSMSSNTSCSIDKSTQIQTGDTWLSQIVPKIQASPSYKEGGVIFITWDQGLDNSPVGMIVLSPFSKKGYSNNVRYTHGSTLRTIQEIFGVSPFLGDAATQTPLDDFFVLSADGKATATLSWSASPGAISYNIKRSNSDGGPYMTVATGITATSYIDKGLITGTKYFYVVTAVNPSGESNPSAQVNLAYINEGL